MSGPIVCGVDDSKAARHAARVAAAISKRIDAPLIFVHVAERELGFPYGDVAAAERRRSRMVRRVRDVVAPGTSAAEPVVRLELGDPAETLAAVASDEGAEMLVVGSRGRGALTAALMGSVSRALVAVAPCPVVVVNDGDRRSATPPRRRGHSEGSRPPAPARARQPARHGRPP